MIPAPRADAPRVCVRWQAPDGARDVVGVLVDSHDGSTTHEDGHGSATERHCDPGGTTITLLPEDRGPVVIPLAQITARRGVPPRVVRPSSSPADLQRVMDAHWPGTERVRLGGWVIRAAGGWTGRANSTLVVGDPGCPAQEALEIVRAFYTRRGLVPRLQVPLREPGPATRSMRPGPSGQAGEETQLLPVLDVLGWEPASPTLVLVADCRDLAGDLSADGGPVAGVLADAAVAASQTWRDAPDAAWLSLLRGGSTPPEATAVLQSGPARYLTLDESRVGHPPSSSPHTADQEREGRFRGDASALAIGRLALVRGWAGISCVEVRPDARRRGLGREVTRRLLADALREGARFVALQVEEDNEPARTLYDSLGFRVHHRYHYRTLR